MRSHQTTFLLVGFFLLFFFSAYSQSLVIPQKIWVFQLSGDYPNPEIYTDLRYKIGNDILIEGIIYKNLLSSQGNDNYAGLRGFIREEENGKVYFRNNSINSDEEYLLYDFGMEPGDTAHLGLSNSYYKLDSVSTNEDGRKVYYLTESQFGNDLWIDGVGSTMGLLKEQITGGSMMFSCCLLGDEQLYHNPNFESCYFDGNNSLKADAGKDSIVCGFTDGEEFQLGGSPAASGGVEPYTYTWSGIWTVPDVPESLYGDATGYLNDPRKSNPTATGTAFCHWLKFYLKVEDAAGNVAYDTVKITNANIWHQLYFDSYDIIRRGDSIQLTGPFLDNEYLPLSYSITPSFGLNDPTDIYGWAKPDSSVTYYIQAQNSVGCVSQKVRYMNIKVVDSKTNSIYQAKIDSLNQLLIGEWEWKNSGGAWGGFGGPEENGYTVKITIKQDLSSDSLLFWDYVNDSLVNQGKALMHFWQNDISIFEIYNVLPEIQYDRIGGEYPYGPQYPEKMMINIDFFNKDSIGFYSRRIADCPEVYYKRVHSTKVFPTVDDHPEWNVQRSIEPFFPGPVFILSYHLDKDTIINQKTYSLVSRTGNQQPHLSYEQVGFIRTDAKKVFFKKSAEGKEYLLYNFGLNVGDTVYCPFLESDSAKYTVLNVDSVNVNGIRRLRLKVLPEYYPEEYMSMYWIEGIGSLWNPFYHDTFGEGGASDVVRCVSTDKGQLYKNPNYDDCTTVLKKTDFIVKEGVVWSGMNIFKDLSGKDSVASYYIKFQGDTILNDRTYSKIWQSNDSLGVNWNMTGLIREADKRVYYHELGYDGLGDLLLYDFSVHIGSTLYLASIDNESFFENMKITNIDTALVDGVKRLRIQIKNSSYTDYWIEKIGSLQGILDRSYKRNEIKKLLLCVQQNGNTIYSNEDYTDCFYTQNNFTGNTQFPLHDKILIYPNPVRDHLFIVNKNGKQLKLNIRLLDINGHIVYNEVAFGFHNKIDVSTIPSGLYFIQIITDGSILNKKIIRQ